MIVTVSRPVVLHRTVRLTASGSMTGVDFRNREVRSLDPGTHTTDEITGLALAGDPIAMGALRAIVGGCRPVGKGSGKFATTFRGLTALSSAAAGHGASVVMSQTTPSPRADGALVGGCRGSRSTPTLSRTWRTVRERPLTVLDSVDIQDAHSRHEVCRCLKLPK